MKMFNVYIVETGEELCVAARSTDHCAEVFVTFWISRSGQAPGEFHVGTDAPDSYQGHPTVQIVAEGDVAGVIVRQQDGSMLFEAAIG